MVWHVNRNIRMNQNQLSDLLVILKTPFYYKQKRHSSTLIPYNNRETAAGDRETFLHKG